MNKYNLLFLIMSSAIVGVLGFLSAILLTKYLTPSEYGYIGLYLSFFFILEQLIYFFSIGLLEIKVVTDNYVDYERFKKNFFGLGVASFIVFSLCLMLASPFLEGALFFLILLTLISSLLRMFLRVHWTELIQKQHAKEFAFKTILLSVVVFLMTFSFIIFIDSGWEERLYAILLAELLFILVFLRKELVFSFFTKAELVDVYKYGIPIFIGLGGAWILRESDKIIVLNFLDYSSLGVYTYAISLSGIVFLLNQAMIRFIKPIIYKKLRNNELSGVFVVKIISGYALILLGVVFCAIFISYMFDRFLFENEYHESRNIFLILLIAFSFFGLYQISSTVMEFLRLNILRAKILYISAFLAFTSSLLLVNEVGILGPAIGTLIGMFVLFMITSFTSLRMIYVK